MDGLMENQFCDGLIENQFCDGLNTPNTGCCVSVSRACCAHLVLPARQVVFVPHVRLHCPASPGGRPVEILGYSFLGDAVSPQ